MNRRQLKRIGGEQSDEPREAKDKERPDDLGAILSKRPGGQDASADRGSDGGPHAFENAGKAHGRATRYVMLRMPRRKGDDDRLVGDERTVAMLRSLNELAALLHDFNRAVR